MKIKLIRLTLEFIAVLTTYGLIKIAVTFGGTWEPLWLGLIIAIGCQVINKTTQFNGQKKLRLCPQKLDEDPYLAVALGYVLKHYSNTDFEVDEKALQSALYRLSVAYAVNVPNSGKTHLSEIATPTA